MTLGVTDPEKLREFIAENRLTSKKHLSNSRDLDPIELIWAYMKCQIEGMDIKSQLDLEDAIFKQ